MNGLCLARDKLALGHSGLGSKVELIIASMRLLYSLIVVRFVIFMFNNEIP